MRVLMTNNALNQRGGSESYLQTVAPELRRLGHVVDFFAPTIGSTAEALRAAGFEVYDDVEALPVPDVIHGQHVNAVAAVRTRFAATPVVFATHSWFVPIEDPTPLLAASAYVCFNDLTQRRLRANAATEGAPIHRLTQPVAVSQFDGHRRPVAATPTRVVAVSRGLKSMADTIGAACARRGIDFVRVGGPEAESADPSHAMRSADVVVAAGRSALEGMALGRAVAVLDETHFGGWVTQSSYAGLEGDGFVGSSWGSQAPDVDALLEGYRPEFGQQARALVAAHHVAARHAVQLVEIYTSVLAGPAPAADQAQALALLAQERHEFEGRALRAEWLAAELQRSLDEQRLAQRRLRRRVRRLRQRLAQDQDQDQGTPAES